MDSFIDPTDHPAKHPGALPAGLPRRRPVLAIRCAQSIVTAVASLGLEVRAGLHTGEVEVVGDDVAGLAVHIGARVAALAGPGEVLVSRTVKDLVAGSGLEFVSRGVQELKGIPDRWEVFAVAG